jgi:uncharacterized protein (TIGR00255 family)
MRSMTGYGRGESSRDGLKIAVEANSINRKQAEVVVVLPRELDPLEARIRDLANRRIGRGRVSIRVNLHLNEETWAERVRLNLPLAKAYARELEKLRSSLGIKEPLNLETLVRIPGVISGDEEMADVETYWTTLEQAVDRALTKLVAMREREGANLCKDLKSRIATIRKGASTIRKHAPSVVRRYQQQLHERIRSAGLDGVSLEDDRLLKEVALFADRSDVTEELTRLESHFQQFEDCVKSAEPVGRMLDFLAQEMNREVNTIGSKANDSAISKAVVSLKAELERFREQVQNIE